MSREEYESACEFIVDRGLTCPAPADLLRGGIIGSVEVIDVVSESDSPWFFGPRGLVLRDPKSCDFIPSQGALGYFNWVPGNVVVPAPARWMLPQAPGEPPKPKASAPKPMPLFEQPGNTE